MPYKPITSVDVSGKTLLFRAGLDLPVEKGRIVETRRILVQARDIAELSAKGARIVVLAHQGRKGDEDCIPLAQHAEAISRIAGIKVFFSKWDSDIGAKIKSMKNGDVLVLDNVRFLKDETSGKAAGSEKSETQIKTPNDYANSEIVRRLAPFADYYVNNAFCSSHRAHASIVGFAGKIPCIAGQQLMREISALSRAQNSKKPRLLILGGAKTSDSIRLMRHMLSRNLADEALLGGIIGKLFLKARGISLGLTEHFLKEKEFFQHIAEAKEIDLKFKKKIFPPLDLAYAEGKKRKEVKVSELPCSALLNDIGSETAMLFTEHIDKAKSVIWNGPLGIYEEQQFLRGTAKVAEAITFAKPFSSGKSLGKKVPSAEPYSVLGGGDTEAAVNKAGFPSEKFSHVSLAGKAALLYLSGEKLPGLEVLEKA